MSHLSPSNIVVAQENGPRESATRPDRLVEGFFEQNSGLQEDIRSFQVKFCKDRNLNIIRKICLKVDLNLLTWSVRSVHEKRD